MHPQIKSITVIFLLLFAVFIQSQNNQFSHYSIDDGLPQSQVNDLFQDDTGYLWLATNGGGIARFDGHNFKVWNESDGLISNHINAISFINSQLFIGTKQGLSIKDNDEIFSYSDSEIHTIIKVDSTIYLATNNGVKTFKNIEINQKSINQEIDNAIINDILFDGKTFWIASNKGFWKIEGLNTKNPKIEKIYNFEVISLLVSKNKIYVATKSNGVFEIKKNSNKFTKIYSIKNVNSMLFNELSDELWITTKNIGIQVVDIKKKRIVKKISLETSNFRSPNSLKVINDFQSNKWVATSNGLYKLTSDGFKHYLLNNTINAVHVYKNSVLAAPASSGVIKIDSVSTIRISDLHQNVYALNSDNYGRVYAGTDDFILVLDSLKVVDTITFTKDIQKIIVKDTTVWVASTTQGINRFKYHFSLKEITDTIRFSKKDGLYDMSINDIQIDSLGRLWYVSNQGFLGFIKDDIVHHFGRKIGNNATIGSLVIYNNYIYLGTHGKGIWWSKLSDNIHFKQLKGRKKLHSSNIAQLIFDVNGTLWAGTQKGIEQIILSENNLITDVNYFGKYDGFSGVETIQNVIDTDAFGNIWVGTIKDLTKFKATNNQVEILNPIIHFEKIEVAYKSIDSVGVFTMSKNKNLLSLQPIDNNLSFSFKTVDINHPNNISYRWRMNTDEWSDWSENSTVVFANLNPGNYNFEAQSKVENSSLSTPIQFQFYIQTALINKLWFRVLIAISLFLILLLVVFLYIKNIKRNNLEKQSKLALENKLLSLEQKALRLQMNPHFIFNVLNGIKALGVTDVDKMKVVIQKFSSLMRATLSNSRQESITLKEEIATLTYYLEVEKILTSKSFDYYIEIDKNIDIEELMIPPMLIQPFVENAIEHGISKVDKKGEITIYFVLKENQLHCGIQDNGIGYEQSLNNKKLSTHQSMALDVTKERIEIISGDKTFKIEELKGKNNMILGTLVTFFLPIITDY